MELLLVLPLVIFFIAVGILLLVSVLLRVFPAEIGGSLNMAVVDVSFQIMLRLNLAEIPLVY